MARRSFSTRAEFPDAPTWQPLEQVAQYSRDDDYLPEIAVDEFMYMGRVRSHGGVAVHLYKHIETRCYLNLDDEGHAYQYLGPAFNDRWTGGRYRAHASLSGGFAGLQLWSLPRDDPYWTIAPDPLWPDEGPE